MQLAFFNYYLDTYACEAYNCSKDDSHAENIDWGHYTDSNGEDKKTCAWNCTNDNNCGTIEWTETECKWWKKGSCKLDKSVNVSFSDKLATCHKPSKLKFWTCDLFTIIFYIS